MPKLTMIVSPRSELYALVPSLSCPAHPRYQAKRPPRVPCKECWALYFVRNLGLEFVFNVNSSKLDES